MTSASCRHTDPMTGVVAEVGTDGVPVGLALPEDLLNRTPNEVARAVLRTLTAAAGEARELLERIADDEWDGRELENAGWDDPTPEDDRWDEPEDDPWGEHDGGYRDGGFRNDDDDDLYEGVR